MASCTESNEFRVRIPRIMIDMMGMDLFFESVASLANAGDFTFPCCREGVISDSSDLASHAGEGSWRPTTLGLWTKMIALL